eukprot:3334525-Pyramimonas_sp.AAC.1
MIVYTISSSPGYYRSERIHSAYKCGVLRGCSCPLFVPLKTLDRIGMLAVVVRLDWEGEGSLVQYALGVRCGCTACIATYDPERCRQKLGYEEKL